MPRIAALALAALLATDTTVTLVLDAGESASLMETVFAHFQVVDGVVCRAERPDVAVVAQGRAEGAAVGESVVACTGTRLSRVAPEEGEDSPVETWTPVAFQFVIRVVAGGTEWPIP